MDYAMEHLEACKIAYADKEFLKRGVETAWVKLEKYYKLTDETPVYVVATLLNPMNKWAYFEQHRALHPQWITTAKKAAKDFWDIEYKPAPASPAITASTSSSNTFYAFYTRREVQAAIKDEWQQYLDAELHPLPKNGSIFNPLAWWCENTQCQTFPVLSQMARDLLSIPAMAADVERLFSAAKLTLTDQRGRMYAETLELLQLLKSWNRSRIFRRVCITLPFNQSS
jgi:hypothetical protein